MARKQQRKKTAARARPRVAPAPAPGAAAAAPGSVPAPAAAAPRPGRTGGGESLVRAVELSLAPRPAGAGRRAQRGLVLDGDPGIPLDRVPFFAADLAKLGIVAAVMLVLLIAGSQLISAAFR